MSRAAARRRAAAFAAAPKLPPAEQQWLDQYRPRWSADPDWEVVQPVVHQIAAGLDLRDESFKQTVRVLTGFLRWLHRRPGRDFDPDAIDAYVLDCISERQRSSIRASLRTGAIAAGVLEPRPLQTAHRPVAAPYSPAELAALLRLCRSQAQPTLARRLRVCVGLGLGAGVAAKDLGSILGSSLINVGPHDADIRIGGNRPRIVPIRRRYVQLVRSGFQGVDEHQKAACPPSRSGTSWFSQLRLLGNSVLPDQSRMRSTWMADLVDAGACLPTILDAAGLAGPRSIDEAVLARHGVARRAG